MEQRIDPNMHLAGQVLLQHLLGVGQILPIRCLGIGDTATDRWAPSRLARSLAAPSKCVDVVASCEEGSEERDLLAGCRTLSYPTRIRGPFNIHLDQGRRRGTVIGSSLARIDLTRLEPK